jgi:predicted DNA-binding protein (MmcQ/YjbR family)
MKSIYEYDHPLHDRIRAFIREGLSDKQIGDELGINHQYIFKFRRHNDIPPGSTFREIPRKLAMPVRARYEKQSIMDFCLSLGEVYEDHPFSGKLKRRTVMRRKDNRKVFAIIYERNGRLNVSLKCEPEEALLLRHVYKSVSRSSEMNKNAQKYWVSVIVGWDLYEERLHEMIRKSYTLTQPKIREQSEFAKMKAAGLNYRKPLSRYQTRTWIKRADSKRPAVTKKPFQMPAADGSELPAKQ